jgi:hypothetical protein
MRKFGYRRWSVALLAAKQCLGTKNLPFLAIRIEMTQKMSTAETSCLLLAQREIALLNSGRRFTPLAS